ncbi:unnamed protein product [Cylicostephanus goldi]|uniref:Uncharacterized protein n=1 Tax=Cylicostephanus goldi TaxID=71465 RepID=A0A3P7MR33_CYLGO|nr:unnamed protein product [Cylicostephanus goldi]
MDIKMRILVSTQVGSIAPMVTEKQGRALDVINVIEVKELELPKSSKISFRSIRLPNSSKVSPNENLLEPTQMAPSHPKISAL